MHRHRNVLPALMHERLQRRLVVRERHARSQSLVKVNIKCLNLIIDHHSFIINSLLRTDLSVT